MSRRALVVFHGHGGHILLPLLKEGFKHCFCVIDDGTFWARIDMMAGVPEVEVVAGSQFDLATFYRNEGMTVVETKQRERPPHRAIWPAHCVTFVKIMLAVSAPLVLTPWGLFRYLSRGQGA